MSNEILFEASIFSICELFSRCHLWGATGHPREQVGVTGLLQPDRSNPRLVLLELTSS